MFATLIFALVLLANTAAGAQVHWREVEGKCGGYSSPEEYDLHDTNSKSECLKLCKADDRAKGCEWDGRWQCKIMRAGKITRGVNRYLYTCWFPAVLVQWKEVQGKCVKADGSGPGQSAIYNLPLTNYYDRHIGKNKCLELCRDDERAKGCQWNGITQCVIYISKASKGNGDRGYDCWVPDRTQTILQKWEDQDQWNDPITQ